MASEWGCAAECISYQAEQSTLLNSDSRNPSEMSGQALHAEGGRDQARVQGPCQSILSAALRYQVSGKAQAQRWNQAKHCYVSAFFTAYSHQYHLISVPVEG